MLHLFLLAGVPHRYTRCIDGRMKRIIAGDQGQILHPPMPKGAIPPTYPGSYRDNLLASALAWVSQRNRDEKFSVTLLYPALSGDGTVELLKDFFPFALVAPYPGLSNFNAPHDIRRDLNSLERYLRSYCARIRSQAKIMNDHLSSRIRRTPFLLPPENFNHPTVSNALEYLHKNAASDPDLERTISKLTMDINGSVRREPKHFEKHYTNDDGLMFEAPNHRDFHGHVHPAGHPARCYLRGRVRLGASYDSEFHFDCVPTRGQLKSSYTSCHDSFATGTRQRLNIAPNEFIR